MKRIISVFLTVVMLLSFAPLSSIAGDRRNVETETGKITYTATTGFAKLLKAAAEESDAAENKAENAVCEITLGEGKASVRVRNYNACTLVVAIYDDTGETMIGYGYKDLEPDAGTVDVDLSVELPEYYVIRGFLTKNHKDLTPVSKKYEDRTHTSVYEEFRSKTTEDFSPELIENLDESAETNFAVYKEGTVIKHDDGEHNIITKADDENEKYTLDNIDDDVRGLQAGDIFHYITDDEEILIVVKSIDIKGDKAVIEGDSEAGLADFYQYVKIDAAAGLSPDAYAEDDDSELPEGLTYKVLDENDNVLYDNASKNNTLNPKLGVEMKGKLSTSIENEFTFTPVNKDKNKNLRLLEFEGEVTGTVKVTASGEVKLALFEEEFFDFNIKIGIESEEHINFTSKATGRIPLKRLKFETDIAGLEMGAECAIKIELEISIEVGFTQTFMLEFGLSTGEGFYDHSDDPENLINTFDVDAEIEVSIGLELSAEIDVSRIKLNGDPKKIWGGEATLEGGLKITGKPFDAEKIKNTFTDDVRHDCLLCIDAEPELYFKIEYEYTKLKNSKKKMTYTPVDVEKRLPYLDFYWSVSRKELGFGDCPHIKYRVGITVVDENNEPLSGAEISYTDENSKTQIVIADSQGRADIYLTRHGSRVVAKAEGSSGYETVKVKDKAQDIVIQIRVKHKLSLTVKDTKGATVPGVDVLVSGNGITENRKTSDKGIAVFDLKAGEYTVTAKKDGAAVSQIIKIDGAKSVTVTLIPQEYKTGITVVDENGKPISGAKVSYKDNQNNTKSATADSQGKVTFYLLTGDYTITAEADGVSGSQNISVKDKDQDVGIMIRLKCKLTVNVKDQNGASVSGAKITLSGNGVTEYLSTSDYGTAVFDLKAGEYTVKAEKDGMNTSDKVKITGEKDVAVTLKLQKNDSQMLVTFGSYPQSEVKDAATLASLNSQSLNWIWYDYYCGGKQENYMEYADVSDVFETGDRYRAVRFSHYRPVYTRASSTGADYTWQDENGYSPNTVYWFKFEPIKWKVLDANTGLIMAESLIDCQPFHNEYYNGYGDSARTHYASNWKYSSIKKWLNDDFYYTAFNSGERGYIQTQSLTTPSTFYSSYDADPTNDDNIYLLSHSDVLTESYGFTSSYLSGEETGRVAFGTDYAKCQGLYVHSLPGYYYSGATYWRLRTPNGNDSTDDVDIDGYVHDHGHSTDYAGLGVRPALNVDLQSAISQSIIKKVNIRVSSSLKNSSAAVAEKTTPEAVAEKSLTDGLNIKVVSSKPKTAAHADCIPGNEYIFVCVKDADADLLADGNLLYIDQKTAENGTIEFTYKAENGTELFFGVFVGDEPAGDYIPGDIDGNGQILADDARLALRSSAKLEELTVSQALAADVDGNGQVLADDARQILRFSAKLQSKFDRV
ncbi:MAG: carboxypeptidase regulatory-like domain-containing protein [Clostridia bacterium]|nr:carboxypeptidase regulatory-like domain-containing protein [Clostridia bacterium]